MELDMAIVPDSENQLLCADPAPQTFDEFARRYQQTIFRYAYGFFQNREDAMEIVQDAFIKLQSRFHQCRAGANIHGWLYRLTHNLCIDHYRKFHKRRNQMLELSQVKPYEADSGEGPAAVLEMQQMQEQLIRAIRELPEKQFQVFHLRHHQGLTLHAISQTLNLSLGTVKTQHHRAVKNLRRFLAKHKVDLP